MHLGGSSVYFLAIDINHTTVNDSVNICNITIFGRSRSRQSKVIVAIGHFLPLFWLTPHHRHTPISTRNHVRWRIYPVFGRKIVARGITLQTGEKYSIV